MQSKYLLSTLQGNLKMELYQIVLLATILSIVFIVFFVLFVVIPCVFRWSTTIQKQSMFLPFGDLIFSIQIGIQKEMAA